MFSDKVLGTSMKASGPAIIPKALPGMKDVFLGVGGQRFKGWPLLKKTVVVGNDGDDGRLLQHHFAKPDTIRRAWGVSPRKVSPINTIPFQEKSGHFRVVHL